jgi:hypothetical protein
MLSYKIILYRLFDRKQLKTNNMDNNEKLLDETLVIAIFVHS